MAWRVSEDEVRDLIDATSSISVSPFITTANAITDRVAAKDSANVLSAAILLEIERYLAAHFYEHRDPQYSMKKTERAEAIFQGQFGMGLQSSKWGQTAILLDETGFLASLNRGRLPASVEWTGLPPSEQTDYLDRN